VDDDSSSASAESTRELKCMQEGKRRRGKIHCLIDKKKCSNADLDEETCLNTCEFLHLVIVSGGRQSGVGDE
jgi:hypothetical protein